MKKLKEEIEKFIPEEEIVDLDYLFQYKLNIDSFNIEPSNGGPFFLNKTKCPEKIEIEKSNLKFEEGTNLIINHIFPISLFYDKLKCLSYFFTLRNEMLFALKKHTNYNSIKIIWKLPGKKNKLKLMDNVNAYELRAYITEHKRGG